jgi:serine/threonine protein kinase
LHTYHDNNSLVSMTRRSPRTLSVGAHNTVVALNEHEVAKLFAGDTRSDIGSEAEKMRFANSVNSPVVRFLRMEFSEEHDAEMLVMERLYQLHAAGFAHRDIRRPSNIVGEPYDNVLLTSNGLRLIDVGVSALREKVGDKLFLRYVEEELKEIEEFRSHFLLR